MRYDPPQQLSIGLLQYPLALGLGFFGVINLLKQKQIFYGLLVIAGVGCLGTAFYRGYSAGFGWGYKNMLWVFAEIFHVGWIL